MKTLTKILTICLLVLCGWMARELEAVQAPVYSDGRPTVVVKPEQH